MKLEDRQCLPAGLGKISPSRLAPASCMLQTGQPKPDVGSQPGTVEANPDGTTDIYFGPRPPTAGPATGSRPSPARGSPSTKILQLAAEHDTSPEAAD